MPAPENGRVSGTSVLASPAVRSQIRTPDQRVRVFVSSTLEELSAERAGARAAITGLHLTAIMFELGARPHPPRELYRAYLAQSEVFVGIYWQQYGWVAPGESTSGLEDEYLLAGDKPKLIYVKAATDREPRLADLLHRIQADDRASYKPFASADDLTELLADDLAVLLTERFTGTGSLLAPTLRRPALPMPLTPIIDREAEITTLGGLLADPSVHLVTLTGPGGIGKTRLAVEVARNWAQAPPGNEISAWYADLAPVTEPALWADALANALGVRPEGSGPVLGLVVDRLQGWRTLIVLDNFEQVLPAAPELGRLLSSCPEVTVLVTSRSALRLRGEHEIPLAPLEVPLIVGSAGMEEIGRSAAVQLLVARAAEVRPGFALTPANAAAVAGLCQRLEGIPLALELAAAQLRVLTPAALLRRLSAGLDSTLDMGTGAVDLPGRQRTLRATIEWSHGLLTEPERALLARLSVFTGAWTLAAAEATGAADGDLDVLATLTSLVAQSLVRTDESDPDEPRFRMLDTIRAYAAERLTIRGESGATIARLARYLIGMVEAVRDDLQGREHRAVSERLDRERDEIRSAISWALQNDDAETVGRLLTPLFTYWWSRGLLPMTSELAEKAAALPSASRLPPYAAALLTGARGVALVMIGRTAEAEPLLRRTIETATALGNARLRSYALLGLAGALTRRSTEEARERLDDAAAGFRGTGDQWGLALTLSTRGQLALLAGDQAGAESMHEEALAAADMIDNDHLRAQVLDMLGLDAITAGDLPGARIRFAAAARLHARMLDYEGSAYALSGLAGLALVQGRPQASARLIGASRHARQVIGLALWPGMQPMDEAQNSAVIAALGPSSFAAATGEGARLGLPDALGYGLAATAADATSDPLPNWAARLRPAP